MGGTWTSCGLGFLRGLCGFVWGSVACMWSLRGVYLTIVILGTKVVEFSDLGVCVMAFDSVVLKIAGL